MTVELLTFPAQSNRSLEMEAALLRAMPMTRSTTYRGGRDLLVLWGPGHPARFEPMRRQIAHGGHVLALDLSYWQREYKVRISIDAAHPQAWVMRSPLPSSRLEADGVAIRDTWKAGGPVIVAGLGTKARVQYGADQIDAWEADMVRACLAQWPERPVRYRRKKADQPVRLSIPATSDGPIEDVLAGASLLVTWHSNVAVDAIRLGIPVVCQDGAAAAVCPSTLPAQPVPLDPAMRRSFLSNLAWFQWAPREAKACLQFVRGLLA